MDAKIFCNTFNLIIEDDYNEGFGGNYLRTNISNQTLQKSIPDIQQWAKIGANFLYSLVDKPHFSASKTISNIKDSAESVNLALIQMKTLVSMFWFVKDNSCNVQTAAIFADHEKTLSVTTTNITSNAKGEFEDYEFSRAEIELAFKYFSILGNMGQNFQKSTREFNPEQRIQILATPHYDALYNSTNRINRAMRFLQYARESPLLPTKISFYVLLLECLFSADDSTEIQHKVGERVALYIGENLEQRLQLYTDVKNYYRVRSKYVHGQMLDKKHNNNDILKSLSVSLDSLVRKILQKILEYDVKIFLLEQEELSIQFNKWLFDR